MGEYTRPSCPTSSHSWPPSSNSSRPRGSGATPALGAQPHRAETPRTALATLAAFACSRADEHQVRLLTTSHHHHSTSPAPAASRLCPIAPDNWLPRPCNTHRNDNSNTAAPSPSSLHPLPTSSNPKSLLDPFPHTSALHRTALHVTRRNIGENRRNSNRRHGQVLLVAGVVSVLVPRRHPRLLPALPQPLRDPCALHRHHRPLLRPRYPASDHHPSAPQALQAACRRAPPAAQVVPRRLRQRRHPDVHPREERR